MTDTDTEALWADRLDEGRFRLADGLDAERLARRYDVDGSETIAELTNRATLELLNSEYRTLSLEEFDAAAKRMDVEIQEVATDGGSASVGADRADETLRLTDEGVEMPEFLKGFVGTIKIRTADVTGNLETSDHGMPETDFYDGPIAVYPDDDGNYNPDLGPGLMAIGTPEHGETVFEIVDERSVETATELDGGARADE